MHHWLQCMLGAVQLAAVRVCCQQRDQRWELLLRERLNIVDLRSMYKSI